ncbi:hypothetical protein [Pseudoalteromonas sp. T1lg24]|uniref:hypothetical protein n=1 Tax=Pseudoalteromonas sp. T1lg24 TaxID=2077099 RepID=UPI000CF69097|nr:hypothetical protein [Pseudoalteromonas sp. T1lg24]
MKLKICIAFFVGVFTSAIFFGIYGYQLQQKLLTSEITKTSIDFASRVNSVENLEKGEHEVVIALNVVLICLGIETFEYKVNHNEYSPSRQIDAEQTLSSARGILNRYREKLELSGC